MRQQLLKRQQKELKKKVNDLKKQEETKEARACLKLNKLMKDV
jgi:flagellar capping protein FliD